MDQHPLAPELIGITEWIHTAPLTMKQLHGQVVAVVFWSLSCSNCLHMAPHLQALVDEFAPKGFFLLGIHSPEVEADKNIQTLKSFLLKKHLTFPVAVDNDLVMWDKYQQHYWPTLYLLDKQGKIREKHVGEGGYARIKMGIEHLLAE